jgi:tight adherence protein B
MAIIISIIIVGAIVMIGVVVLPPMLARMKFLHTQKEQNMAREMDNMFYDKQSENTTKLYFFMPIILAVVGFILSKNFLFAIVGGAIGLSIPTLMLKMRVAKRKAKFSYQLLDAINLLSSSLKGGLSLLQALEVVVEEMPAPISQELGLVVRENKMGITLEESLNRLYKRMSLEDLRLVINSVLVARETGGDLTKVFSRLSVTIRDNRKLQENIKTLTMQGKMQAVIMSVLPFLFVGWVITVNKHHFDVMLNNDMGRMLLILAVVLQVGGMFLIQKFSVIKI